ncbi:MAG: response regulator transcription factor [Planctomycetota bacterium]
MVRILIIDDDTELCEMLAEFLSGEGYETICRHTANDGVSAALTGDFALVILDVMLPDMSGFDALKKIRLTSNIPVVMLTAKGDVVDRIVGLEIGADDYLPKPFNPRELSARINAQLRRSKITASGDETDVNPILTIDDVVINSSRRIATVNDTDIKLTGVEFDILRRLLASAGDAVSRETLAEDVLKRPLFALDRSIDVHISNIRKKLGPASDGRDRIIAIRSVGYQYVRQGASD